MVADRAVGRSGTMPVGGVSIWPMTGLWQAGAAQPVGEAGAGTTKRPVRYVRAGRFVVCAVVCLCSRESAGGDHQSAATSRQARVCRL